MSKIQIARSSHNGGGAAMDSNDTHTCVCPSLTQEPWDPEPSWVRGERGTRGWGLCRSRGPAWVPGYQTAPGTAPLSTAYCLWCSMLLAALHTHTHTQIHTHTLTHRRQAHTLSTER